MIKVIEFLNVSKSFKKAVLSNVSFDCYSSNTYFLYGDSSSGKTTVLKLLLKDIDPDNGMIRICGDSLLKLNGNKLRLYRQQLGIIWQDLLLLEQKTVFENIVLPLIISGHDGLDSLNKVYNLLKEVDLFNHKDSFIQDLTLGQRQIVAILRAIVNNPKIILADEPMNHIDTAREKVIWDIIHKYKDPNAVVLFTTSQKYIIDTFEGNMLNINNGSIVVK